MVGSIYRTISIYGADWTAAAMPSFSIEIMAPIAIMAPVVVAPIVCLFIEAD